MHRLSFDVIWCVLPRTIRYPIGTICETTQCYTNITIDINAMSNRADLVVAFGTQTLYFAVIVPYDGKFCISCCCCSCSPEHQGGLFLIPTADRSAGTDPLSDEPWFAPSGLLATPGNYTPGLP